MITILIIGLLAAMILGVAAVAGETARESKTRRVVNQLHTLLTEHYETYKTRRVKVRPEVINQIDITFANNPARRGQAMAEARLYALRELMLMEMPDRWSDVWLSNTTVPGNPVYLDAPEVTIQGVRVRRTPLAANYLRRYWRLKNNADNNTDVSADDIASNQGAECLYMIITLATGDGEARGMFGESVIGDFDGDGAPEFLDGWGQPIEFLRWAPGFESDIQLNLNRLSDTNQMSPSEANAAVASDHDPFDMFRVEPIAFRLVPLIYSPGRDDQHGVYFGDGVATWTPGLNPSFIVSGGANTPPYLAPQLTPYDQTTNPNLNAFLGTISEGSTDNVHNHLIGTR